VSKRPRRIETVPRADIQGDANNGETYWVREEGVQMTKTGAQSSLEKITIAQVEEMCKKMKYTKQSPVITQT
jgi:hypothetical protein